MVCNRRVVIVQRRLTHYRVPFFTQLRKELLNRDVHLDLVVGQGLPKETSKGDGGFLDWAVNVPTRYFVGGQLCWQPLQGHIANADMVVITQENKLLYNHLLLMQRRPYRLAFWGHGANLQSDSPNGLKESFKRWTTTRVDWWFAYTQMSANLVRKTGFPSERITDVNNAVDTSLFRKDVASVSDDEVIAMRKSLGFDAAPVGLFLGSLYDDKRLDFLFAVADAIRQSVPGFRLLLVGDGPEGSKVRALCANRPWARWVGSQVGHAKAVCLRAATVMLNPGLVGLGILDSFVGQVPMVTTDCGIHSPEISYLESGYNGVMTENLIEAYTSTIVNLLCSSTALNTLRAGCANSALAYTVENMATRFADGVAQCLAGPPYVRRASLVLPRVFS